MRGNARGQHWEPGPVVAWTASDGPGELPPTASRLTGAAAAVAAGVAGFGMLTADTVCPEHSLLIDLAATAALVLTVVGVVATVKASAAAPALILAASVFGVSIAVVGALHDVTLGVVVAGAFAVAAVISSFAALRSARLRAWERRVLDRAEAPLDPELFRAPADARVTETHEAQAKTESLR